MRKIIAIDFDGCLVENRWPEIGEPKQDVINAALREQKNGAALILWTCRTGRRLSEAVTFCHALGLDFDAVNDNLPELVETYGGSNCRKVVATEYWDDRAVRMPVAEAPKCTPVVYCEECRHVVTHHYEKPGEKPYIKYTCGSKYGLNSAYAILPNYFCCHGERRACDND